MRTYLLSTVVAALILLSGLNRSLALDKCGDNSDRLSESYFSDIEAAGISHWSADKMPIRVFFTDCPAVVGYDSTLIATLSGAFDEWVSATDGKLSWVRTHDSQNADVTVRWTNRKLEVSNGVETGETRTLTGFNLLTNRGRMRKANLLLSTSYVDRKPSAGELQRTYLHEAGHVFGIAGHSRSCDDAMYTFVEPGSKPGRLSARDRETMRRIYAEG